MSFIRRMPRFRLLRLLGLPLAYLVLLMPGTVLAKQPNILFIAVDDLRPQLGCYGQDQIVSPNIDRLASQGVLFERAYCMVPTCGASRASLFSSVRPARNRFVAYTARADKEAPWAVTLNSHFKKHGYHTVSNGKVLHFPNDSEEGWSEPPWRPDRSAGHYVLEESLRKEAANARIKEKGRGPPFEAAAVSDEAYADGQLAERAVADLKRLAGHKEPFFLAVGFFKPHLPFVAPKKYWELYRRDEIRLPKTYHVPTDAPPIAIHTWGELRAYAGVPEKGPVDDEFARTLIHGYYACVSYTDAQIGKLLDELDHLGIRETTVIVLWGDHGWNLGEHTLWCKHCTFETSMHAPLIVSAPGFQKAKTASGLIEFIDIYPTLCELAGLPIPSHVEGKSFMSILRNPDLPFKKFAIGRFRQSDSIRTDRFRYSEYSDDGGEFLARMLYDHDIDPEEDINVAERSENGATVTRLRQLMRSKMGRDH